MKKTTGLLLSFALALLAQPARAADAELVHSTRLMEYQDSHYSTFTRVSVTGGASVMNGDASGSGYHGTVAAEFGRGWFTAGLGASYLSLPLLVGTNAQNVDATVSRQTVNAQYIGVPLVAKFNYIEHRDSSFSLKVGAMPAFMMSSGSAVNDTAGSNASLTLGQSELFALAGFEGSTPISKTMAFLIDGTFLYGTTDVDGFGARAEAVIVSAGLRFNL